MIALTPVIVALATVLGLAVGSFLNVVIYRVPAGKSIVAPASACPQCGHEIRGYDNIPVLSWLVLRGKCRDCGASISARYPLVELGTGLAFGAVAWWVLTAANGDAAGAASVIALILACTAFLYLAAISIALALIDLDTKRLPNAIVLPSYVVGSALLVASALLAGQAERLIPALVGMSALWTLYYVLAFVSKGGMGMGDVKLAGVLGLYLGWAGWGQLFVGTFAGFLLGGVFGIALLLVRRAGRKTAIPFGPWMLAGAWVGLVAGPLLVDRYLVALGVG
ncbi:prepilin peptidase [Agromyces sp. MMS24-JH15]|uniref:prepilin peptidase n=1 Tax=Agromyces sp. MMS24-JH15 TaxID=3243765 RepID=UPI003748BAC2